MRNTLALNFMHFFLNIRSIKTEMFVLLLDMCWLGINVFRLSASLFSFCSTQMKTRQFVNNNYFSSSA